MWKEWGSLDCTGKWNLLIPELCWSYQHPQLRYFLVFPKEKLDVIQPGLKPCFRSLKYTVETDLCVLKWASNHWLICSWKRQVDIFLKIKLLHHLILSVKWLPIIWKFQSVVCLWAWQQAWRCPSAWSRGSKGQIAGWGGNTHRQTRSNIGQGKRPESNIYIMYPCTILWNSEWRDQKTEEKIFRSKYFALQNSLLWVCISSLFVYYCYQIVLTPIPLS